MQKQWIVEIVVHQQRNESCLRCHWMSWKTVRATDRMNEWTSESMIQWMSERKSRWISSMNQWTDEYWINGINEPMNKWFSESISQWSNEPRAPTTVSSKFYCPHLKVFHSVLRTSIFLNNWKCKSISRYSPGQSCALFVDSFPRSRPAPAETETLYFGDLRGHITRKNTGFRAG